MKLKDYLKGNKIRRQDFADKIPVHLITLSRWIRNISIPTPLAFERIKKLTKGNVTEKDFDNEDAIEKTT